MDPLQQAFCRKLSQITPDGVLGEAEFMAEVFGYYLAVSRRRRSRESSVCADW